MQYARNTCLRRHHSKYPSTLDTTKLNKVGMNDASTMILSYHRFTAQLRSLDSVLVGTVINMTLASRPCTARRAKGDIFSVERATFISVPFTGVA